MFFFSISWLHYFKVHVGISTTAHWKQATSWKRPTFFVGGNPRICHFLFGCSKLTFHDGHMFFRSSSLGAFAIVFFGLLPSTAEKTNQDSIVSEKTNQSLRKQLFCLLPLRLWENKSKSQKGTECRDLMASPKNHTVRQPYKQSPTCSWTDMTHGKPGSPLWTLVRS